MLAVLLALSAVVAGVLSGVFGRAAFEEGSAARRALTVDGTAGAEIVTRRAADPAVQDETVRRIIGSCFGDVRYSSFLLVAVYVDFCAYLSEDTQFMNCLAIYKKLRSAKIRFFF